MNMKTKLLAVAVAGALVAPAAFAQQATRCEPLTDWGGWGGGRRKERGRVRIGNNRRVRTSAQAYKAQRAANRDRRRRGA